ncbi:MAG: hypothetical protein KatS3mg014_2393 [Actinomycetota bacterium]|nr:MAG: hypothetical protein KatS3mg014_2393 [Actinomycetota bacterium]
MQVAVRLAGYTMGEADTLRKVMGKKKRELLPPHREKFVRGAVARGEDPRRAEEIFELIVPFADYGFNASHACAYAYVAYQTAYLKAHHPVEYMAAILTSVKDDKDRKPFYLNACRLMGIEVLPPDVNESELDFAPVRTGEPRIRYGLSAVRNVGEGAVDQIIRARETKGEFTSFADFCRKVDPSVLTKKVLESLILAGAFDSLGYPRKALFENHEKVSGPILAERKAEAAGQFSLFGGGEAGPAGEIDESCLHGEEFEKRLLLKFEKEMLGQFVTDHPLLEVRDRLAAQVDVEIPDLATLDDGDLVTVGGIVGAVARRYTKRGEPYAQFRLEDLTGGVTVIAFPNVYEQVPHLIETDAIVLVRGRVDRRGRAEEVQLRAVEILEPELSADRGGVPAGALVIELPAESCTQAVLAKLRSLLEAHPGRSPVKVRFVSSQGVTPLEVGAYRVTPTEGLLSELRLLLGPRAVRVEAPERPRVARVAEPAPAGRGAGR